MKALENDPIRLSNNLISSLLDGIPHAETFKGKWSLIRAKLAELQSQLTEFAESSNSSSFIPLSLDLLQTISQTLSDVVSLCEKCQTRNFSEGKLRAQSDIDSVLAKLDRHVKDNVILIRSGVLHEGVALSSSPRSPTLISQGSKPVKFHWVKALGPSVFQSSVVTMVVSNYFDDCASSHGDVGLVSQKRNSETASSSHGNASDSTTTRMAYLPNNKVLFELRH